MIFICLCKHIKAISDCGSSSLTVWLYRSSVSAGLTGFTGILLLVSSQTESDFEEEQLIDSVSALPLAGGSPGKSGGAQGADWKTKHDSARGRYGTIKGWRLFRLLNSYYCCNPPSPPPIVCPKSHRSMTHKYNRTPTGQYPYLLHSWTCLIACSPQALPSLNLDGYWLTCEAWGDRWECHTGILTCTMSNFLAGKHAEIFLPYHFLLPWRFPCVLWWETGFSSVS